MLYWCIYIHTYTLKHHYKRQTPYLTVDSAHHCSCVLQKLHQDFYFSIFIVTISLRTEPLQLQEQVPQARFASSVNKFQTTKQKLHLLHHPYQLWLWFCCSAGLPVSFTCRKKFDKKSMPISKLKWEWKNAEYCIKPLYNTSTVESFKHLKSLRLLNLNSGKAHFSMDMQRHLNTHPRHYRISLFVLFMV